MRALPSSQDFARFEVFTGIFESVCLSCNRLLGVATKVRGLDILEKAHECSAQDLNRVESKKARAAKAA